MSPARTQSSYFACKLFYMVHIPAVGIASQILATMTIEKCYVIVNPYKSKPTRKQALTIATASLIPTTLIISTHVGIIFGLTPLPLDNTVSNTTKTHTFHAVDSQTVCAVLPQYTSYTERVFLPINLLLWRVIAPVTVIICNLTIGIFLRKHAMQVARLNATPTSNNDKRITRLLIIVSHSFVLLILPSGIFFVLVPFLYENAGEALAPDNMAYQAVKICVLINHSINFFLYIMASKTFRKEAQTVFKSLFGIFCCRK